MAVRRRLSNISEAVEAGATSFLIDEDTCATNFMIRDTRMAKLVKSEPITPYIKRVKPFLDGRVNGRGISTILVVGASGDFFPVADTVICMESYTPSDVT